MLLPILIQSLLYLSPLTICLRLIEHRQQRTLNVLPTRCLLTLLPGTPPLLHRIQEARCLAIPEIFKHTDIKRSHHIMIFMNQIVAVKHVDTIPRREFGEDLHFLVDAKENDVFEGDLLVFEHRPFAVHALHDLEVDQVHVYWVRPAATVVFELPKLDLTPWRFCEEAVLDIGEGYAIDGPFAIAIFGSIAC